MYVGPCISAASQSSLRKARKIASVAIVAPMVIVPPVRALPMQRMSGRTSAASQAKRYPVRQKPVAISSAMKRTSCFFAIW